MFRIDNRVIDKNSPCFIIAELSANHNGSLETAIETIRAARRAGADAIKFQTYTADTITLPVKKPDFLIGGDTLWDGKYLHDLYQEAYTPWEWHQRLFEVAEEEGLICFSSPFDTTSVDFLEKLDVPAYKIASFEITDIPLIRYAAGKGKPMIISTGIATYDDIRLAVETCHDAGNRNICLLKCTSSYPAPIEEANMIMVDELAREFGVVTGLSDHTMGAVVPIVSVCFGAKIIEKHFILDRAIGGPDAAFSMNEQEFTKMVKAVRQAESAIGVVSYELTEKQASGRAFSKSLYPAVAIKKGDVIKEGDIRSVRPGYSLHPRHLTEITGKRANRDLEAGDRIGLGDFG
jgi:pseudaminic acid synthase